MQHIDFITSLSHEELRAKPYGGSIGSLHGSDPGHDGKIFYSCRASDDVYAGLLRDPDIKVLHNPEERTQIKTALYQRNPNPRFHPHHH